MIKTFKMTSMGTFIHFPTPEFHQDWFLRFPTLMSRDVRNCLFKTVIGGLEQKQESSAIILIP